ncbi:cilia- and flagella-associated protein 20-like [Lycorma delicatula]|uniref:cilia- and flagella-associated protein 20-like n=1 Tax=Lycorma delicatula TaxID=130591 RepID=UPI003F511A7B
MFKNAYQHGLLSVFFAGGSKPLAIWGTTVKEGHVKRMTDEEARCLVLEIKGANVATTYIFCPPDPSPVVSLGIRLPFIVIIVKNLKKYFSFEIQVLDGTNTRRRFRVSNYQSTSRIRPFICTMPLGLNDGWNQVQFNLDDFVRRAYNTTYIETQRLQIHANCRLRRIYFADRLYTETELPTLYKILLPVKHKNEEHKTTNAE